MVQRPTRQSSSYSLLWKHEISQPQTCFTANGLKHDVKTLFTGEQLSNCRKHHVTLCLWCFQSYHTKQKRKTKYERTAPLEVSGRLLQKLHLTHFYNVRYETCSPCDVKLILYSTCRINWEYSYYSFLHYSLILHLLSEPSTGLDILGTLYHC
jgi:hypothetical protein